MASQKSNAAITADDAVAPGAAKLPQRERGVRRVAALLDAAAAIFAEKGYDAATMTEIAQRAGAAIGSLYQFFPSKEALADALLLRYAERVDETLEGLAQAAASLTPVTLADALVDLMLAMRSDRAAAIALTDRRGDAADKRSAVRAAMRGQLARTLRGLAPGLPPARATAMATMMLHLLKAVPALAEEDPTGRKGLVREARRALAGYVALSSGARLG